MIKWKNDHDDTGYIEVQKDGTIQVEVSDDWYSGVIDKEGTRKLFDALCSLYDVIQEPLKGEGGKGSV